MIGRWCVWRIGSPGVGGSHDRPADLDDLGFYAYLIARGDTTVTANPVPRGLSDAPSRRDAQVAVGAAGAGASHVAANPGSGRSRPLLRALRSDRDRAMVLAMLLGGLRRCEVLGLRLEDILVGDRRPRVHRRQGRPSPVVPVSDRFFASVGDYLRNERPEQSTDRPAVRGVEATAAGSDRCRPKASTRSWPPPGSGPAWTMPAATSCATPV